MESLFVPTDRRVGVDRGNGASSRLPNLDGKHTPAALLSNLGHGLIERFTGRSTTPGETHHYAAATPAARPLLRRFARPAAPFALVPACPPLLSDSSAIHRGEPNTP